MDILTIGPWVLLALSVLLVAVAAYAVVKQLPRGLMPSLFFGVLLGGLAIHGIAFLDPYGKLLQQVADSPSEATYERAFDAIGRGKVPEPYERAIVALSLQNPTENLEQTFAASIAEASDGGGKRVLSEAQEALRSEKRTAQLAQKGLELGNQFNEIEIGRLPVATRHHIVDALLERPDIELRAQGLDRARLRELTPE